jgi:hypothetical protein
MQIASAPVGMAGALVNTFFDTTSTDENYLEACIRFCKVVRRCADALQWRTRELQIPTISNSPSSCRAELKITSYRLATLVGFNARGLERIRHLVVVQTKASSLHLSLG